ncbi:hypothetical protein N7470_002309 [Penicillium chermesinum]|nr:hypothetical protein N7470_002309 [Penicillium chermesinum]
MENTPPSSKPPSSSTKTEAKMETESHRLSKEYHDCLLAAKKPDDPTTIADLGWHRPPAEFEEPIVAGLSNDDLWMLIRRFDRQIYNVRALPEAPPQDLDLIRAAEEEFSPDKLRSTLERFYMTVVISLANFVKHCARLRSWKEPQRTGLFCAVYCIAWLRDGLIPTFFALLLALILSPACRKALFPLLPLLCITGAPENFKGEAVENEASNLVAGVASVAVGSAIGKDEQAKPDDDTLEEKVPDLTAIVDRGADAQNAANGESPTDSADKTRQPMKKSVMETANWLMNIINDISDTHEKFGNALSGTPPFSQQLARLRLASVVFPLWLVSMFTPSYVMIKISGLLTGFIIFGDPVVVRGIAYLNRYYPNWPELLQLGNTLLKGIPTNAQLTLTLLRIGEANLSPLPPPPAAGENPPSRPASLHKEELSLGASHSEIEEAALKKDKHPATPPEPSNTHKKTWTSSIIAIFRGTTAGGIESKRAFDRVRAVAGSSRAANRTGVLRTKGKMDPHVGPVEFEGRYKGKRGVAVIDTSKEPPVLYFTTDKKEDNLQVESRKSSSVLFTIPVTEIQALKKQGGMGWKGKLVVGWAMGSKEVVDGLLIEGKDPKHRYQLTAMGTRDQLFNRLIAMDGQMWERC